MRERKKQHRRLRFKPRFYIIAAAVFILTITIISLVIKPPVANDNKKIGTAENSGQTANVDQKQKQEEIEKKVESKKNPSFSPEIKEKVDTVKAKLDSDETSDLKVVFFSFDDGPGPYSAEVLNLLKKHNIKATFFTNGREGEEMEALYRRIVDEGHTLANHTWSHQYDLYKDPTQLLADVTALEDYQKKVTGLTETSHLFRFPGGALNANDACTNMILENGYNYVDWNVECGDGTSNSLSAETLAQNFIDGVHGHNVSTVLCHAERKESTKNALDRVFTTLISEGYTFLPMSSDINLPRQR